MEFCFIKSLIGNIKPNPNCKVNRRKICYNEGLLRCVRPYWLGRDVDVVQHVRQTRRTDRRQATQTLYWFESPSFAQFKLDAELLICEVDAVQRISYTRFSQLTLCLLDLILRGEFNMCKAVAIVDLAYIFNVWKNRSLTLGRFPAKIVC